MRITESKIRQIIRQEAGRVLGEARGLDPSRDPDPPRGRGSEPDEHDREAHLRYIHRIGEPDDEELYGEPGAEAGGFYGGYDDSGLVHLDSGNKELDDMWERWAGLTLELYRAHGSKSFNSESAGGKQTVARSMVEFIENDLPSEL